MEDEMKRAIITSAGVDKVGITAAIANYLAECNVGIIYFNSSLKQDYYYNIMAIVNIENYPDYDKFVAGLNETGEKLGIIIHCQLAEIFEAMHRI